MRSIIVSLLLVVTSLVFYSCASAPAEIVVAKYGDYNITLDEFKEAYNKSSGETEKSISGSDETVKDFLDLYVNFKMKLRDAEVRGYNDDPDVLKEIESYKKQIGKSYIFEKEITEPGVRKLYDRRKYEFRIRHLMIGIDTISAEKAESFARELIERINAGEVFEDLVKQYSTDEKTKDNNGDLYYVTAGDFLPEFEDPIYTTPVGSVYNEPLRSRVGYHIIKVVEKKERIPAIRARHILARVGKDEETGLPDTAAAYAKIQEAMKEINNGADFAKVAGKYSDDIGSAQNGGDIGFFERRKTVIPFDEASFNLDVNEISDIVRTSFGYHIIQLVEKKEYPSYTDEHEKLKNLFSKHFYKVDYKKYTEALRIEFKNTLNLEGLDYIISQTDSTILNQDYWESDFRNRVKDTEVFRIADQVVTFDSLMSKFINQKKLNDKLLNGALLDALVQSYSEELLFDLKSAQLDKVDPEFAKLMQEYKNGILVFKLHDEEIWTKMRNDDSLLLDYYTKNRKNYMWNTRVRFTEIMTKSDSLARACYQMLEEGSSFDSLAAMYTEREGFKEKAGRWGYTEIDRSPLAQKVNELKNPGDYTKLFDIKDEWYILRLDERVPGGLKPFPAAKPEVATHFQEVESKRLETEYIKRLRDLYKPVTNYDVLEKINN